MFSINENFLRLNENYLFTTVAEKVKKFSTEHPDANIIRLGIGDVTLPLPPAVIKALHKAVDEMAVKETFRGYGPERGYDFLLEKIAENDYRAHGIDISTDEIFVSDGAKSDTGNIVDILSENNVVGITDPVYPVYLDSNIMRIKERSITNSKIVFLPCHAENNLIARKNTTFCRF
jgi:LL-diaminopimelate aminotransferase